ncbi:MAG TPA: GspMb/PilO family protein [Longimicrobiaceae bacterium]|nr:GspMb/PilO family protein [Longimicrobiaceae bacterium]
MSALHLGSRDRRALVLGAILLAPALLFALVLKPYLRTLSEVRDGVAQERSLLSRELGMLAEARLYPAILDSVEVGIRAESPRLFGGRDPLAATAALADYVGESAARSRILVERSETRVPETAGEALVPLRVELQAAGDLQGILTFLRRLERGEKLVRVERITIEQARSYAADPETERLSLSATIHGYTLAAEEAPR